MKRIITIKDLDADIEVENTRVGICLDAGLSRGLAYLTPSEARKIASALNEAADEQEKPVVLAEGKRNA